jgi:glycosyltransferase involved in cell wall biosynthesis
VTAPDRRETGASDGDLRHLYDDLRAELDHVRLENQRLRIELGERSRLSSVLRLRLRQARAAVPRALRRARRSLRGRAADASTAPPPYVVRHARVPAGAVRPRVLHVVGNLHLGGSAQLVVDLVERLGHRYEQAVLSRDVPERPAYAGLEVVHAPRLSGDGDALAVLRQWKPDLIHVHYLGHHRTAYSERDWAWYHRVFRAAELRGVPVVENINIPTEPYVSGAVRSYVYVSDYVRMRFGRGDGSNATIYPGSDLDLFARNGRPVPDDTIGLVYRLERDKLNEDSVDPLIEVVRRRPRTRAIVVGGGGLLEEFQLRVERAGMAGSFTFTGYVPYAELPSIYSRISVFVAPVHRESFGQVTPFAMGMEVPVAGYRVGALPEILGSDETLADPGDATGLAGIVCGLLEDRDRRLRTGTANRDRALRLFSVESMVARYEELYDSALAEPQAGVGRAGTAARRS